MYEFSTCIYNNIVPLNPTVLVMASTVEWNETLLGVNFIHVKDPYYNFLDLLGK